MAETYDVLINCIKTNPDQNVRFKLMHIAEETTCENTVAYAAPSTPVPITYIRK